LGVYLWEAGSGRADDGDVRRVADADRVGADADNGAIFFVEFLESWDERAKELESRPPQVGESCQKWAFDVLQLLIARIQNKRKV
jgi:hypothetical protein